MGIFDNVNWQQAVPGALMGFAGGMDPRSSPMLAQSGWNAVKSYMEQQQMQQQQEQFQERLKLYKEEQSQRERQLKMRETSFAKEQEEKLDEDFIFQNLGVLSDISDEAGISEYYNRLNLKAKESGRGPLSSTVFGKVAKQWEFMPTATGEVGFGYKSDGSLWVMEKVKHKGGVKWQPSKVADRITPEMIKALRENPEMALEFAGSLDKSGHKQAAEGVRTQAQRILDEKKSATASRDYAERLKSIGMQRESLTEALKQEWNWDPDSKTYVNPHAEGTPERKEWEEGFGKAKKAVNDRILGQLDALDREMQKANPDYGKEVKKQKGREAAEFEKTLTPEERETYIWSLKDLARMGVPREEAGPRIRATIELQRKQKTGGGGGGKPAGGKAAGGKPTTEPGKASMLPLGNLGMNALGHYTNRAMEHVFKQIDPLIPMPGESYEAYVSRLMAQDAARKKERQGYPEYGRVDNSYGIPAGR